ncbi:MAG: alpha/beta hydrolase [Planctomycetaceae bacterium]
MSVPSPEVATSGSPVPDHLPVPSSTVPAGVPVNAEGVPSGEACPPPLVWHEVLNAYRSDSRPWELDRGTRRLVGRVWGEGPPLYLLNGFVGTAEMYALIVYLLRDTFRCVVYDTVGELGSHRLKPQISDYAADLLAAADLHGDATFCVFAPSFGAAVAMQASLDAPNRVERMVLQHGFANRRLSFSERTLAWFARNSRKSLAQLPWRRRIQELNHRRWFPPFDGSRFEFLVESTGKLALGDLAQKAQAIHAMNLNSQLAEVKCPVILVRTEGQGPLETAGHESLEKGLPNARTEWLHSTGLHPYLTHPHRLAKILKGFKQE